MAYTEFRKSYSDFEIVIPAIDHTSFSENLQITSVLQIESGEPQ